MDQRLPPPTPDTVLYEADYYAWVQSQVAGLRALARSGRADLPLDLENLAEEVEDMGKSELRAVESLIEQILIHLLKVRFAPRPEPVKHWEREIDLFRRQLRRRYSKSMRAAVLEGWDDIWLAARLRTLSALEAEVPGLEARMPADCPWTLEQIVAADDPDRV